MGCTLADVVRVRGRARVWAMASCVGLGCGLDSIAPVADSSTGIESTTSSEGSASATTTGVASTTSSGDTTGTTTSTTSGSSDGATLDTGHGSCGDVDLEDCAGVGCQVHPGIESRYDADAGVCIEIGPLDLCASSFALAAPVDVWRVDERGDVRIVHLLNAPSDLGPWSPCGCDPGDPFACWGCVCLSNGSCGDNATADECAAEGRDCRWVDAVVVEGDGTGCVTSEPVGRCVTVLPAKADCALASPPDSCGWTEPAPPYVRPVDGGIEVITGVACDVLPYGYMPCWSAPGGDPAACACAC